MCVGVDVEHLVCVHVDFIDLNAFRLSFVAVVHRFHCFASATNEIITDILGGEDDLNDLNDLNNLNNLNNLNSLNDLKQPDGHLPPPTMKPWFQGPMDQS